MSLRRAKLVFKLIDKSTYNAIIETIIIINKFHNVLQIELKFEIQLCTFSLQSLFKNVVLRC